MANKSVRLLSLVLSVLMLVSMVPIMASAEYDYSAAEAPANYVIIAYDKLVGDANKKFSADLYIVDADWSFAKGSEPAKVTFKFQNKEVTETYDATRHFSSYAAAYSQAKQDGIGMPKILLTEGNYSEEIKLAGSVYLLGARAGINPNVPSNDPSAKWALNSERALAAYESNDPLGETRFWIEGALDAPAGYGGSGSAYTKRLLDNTASGDAKYVFDGLVLQGYGAVVRDTAGGTGTRIYNAQNCIFNNGWSYDVSTFRLWNRGVTANRQLNVSNCYATGYKQLGFYSGHASKLSFNGLCWQDNYAGLCYDTEHMGLQGFSFTLENSHFWNSEEVSSTPSLGSMFHYDRIFYSDFNQGASSTANVGSNSEPYRYTINNNTFWNMERVIGGAYQTNYNIIEIPMGGENEKVVLTNNIFGNTMATSKRHPLQIRYLTVNGVPSHSAETPSLSDTTTMYALTKDNIEIGGNTFVGKAYTNVMPDIGNNTAPDTLVEMYGNFYTTSLDSNLGTYVEGKFGDIIYDKWVWTDNSEAGMQDPKNRTDYINEEAFSLGGLTAPTVDPEDPYHYIYSIGSKASVMVWGSADNSAGVNNIVKFYTADEEYNKISELTASSLTAPERENYYVASILSKDRRTSVDYKVTVVRDIYAGAELAGIKEDAYPEIKFLSSDETNIDLFSYVVGYDNEEFSFALDVADDATTKVYIYNARGTRYMLGDNGTVNHYTMNLPKTETVYPIEVEVTSAAGKTEKYLMQVSRGLNDEAALEEVTSAGNTVTKDEANKTYTITVPVATEDVAFEIAISKNATATVVNGTTGYAVSAVNGSYKGRVRVGTQAFYVTVVSQDGLHEEEWTVNVVRPASTEKEVLNVENATKTGSGWTANVETNKFIVFATVSPLASYSIYADASCNQKISDAAITLEKATTIVYIQVTAEDGSKSGAVSVTIVTTDANVGSDILPDGFALNDGIIAVQGATKLDDGMIFVELGEEAKSYDFAVLGLNGYSIKMFGDARRTLWAPLEMTIVPDTAYTMLYATADNGENQIDYTIVVLTTVPVEFNDKIVEWAKPYVDAMVEAQLGIVKGDEHGALNGTNNLSRYEMAVMMVRLTGVNKDLYKDVVLPFQDTIVPWAENYVKAAYRIQLVGGHELTDTEGNVVGYEFKGEDKATRAQFIKVFVNAVYGEDITEYYEANKEAIDKKVADLKFTDADKIAAWAVPYVHTAVYMDLVKGDDGALKTEANITRYEAVTLISRCLFD